MEEPAFMLPRTSINKHSLSLAPFLKHEGLTIPPIPSALSPPYSPHTSHNMKEHSFFEDQLCSLTIEDHLSRQNSSILSNTGSSTYMEISPHDSRASSYSLYPAPPHLTPHPSPTHSRPQSPSGWDHHDHAHSTDALGTLTVTVVEARGLSCHGGREKPYVLLQYDRTESVGREFGAVGMEVPSEKQKKSGFLGNGKIRKDTVSVRRVGVKDEFLGGRVVSEEPPTGDPSIIGTPSAPIWNHSAKFDVVTSGRTLLLCVYDKLAKPGSPTNGFLGASVFEPDLIPDPGDEGEGFEIWVPLKSALDSSFGGEVRLKILFEAAKHTRPKLCVDDFQILRKIGEGSFGQVYRVRKRDTKRIYAMKVIAKKGVKSASALAQVLAERQVLARTLDSPFLVGLKFSFQSKTELFFVIDYKSGGELFEHLTRNGGRFEEEKVRFYLCEIILALSYLHSQNIIYRDLKPENCLLDGSGHVVLVDFGLSKVLGSCDDLTKTICGTTSFLAPEILLDVGYNCKADWWSTGVLMYEMLFGFSPFYAETRVDEYERILSGEIKIPTRRGHSEEARDLLSRLLERSPDVRIGANGGGSEIQAHPFFLSVDWIKCSLRQIAPPFKPGVPADLDASDYHDMGRSGDWMFNEWGGCYQTKSSRPSMVAGKFAPPDDLDLDAQGIFRDFNFTAKLEEEKEERFRRSSWNGEP